MEHINSFKAALAALCAALTALWGWFGWGVVAWRGVLRIDYATSAAAALRGGPAPAMAGGVGQSTAKKILIPMNQCDNIVAGVEDLPVSKLLDSALEELDLLLNA